MRAAVFAVFLLSCGGPQPYDSHLANVTHYGVKVTRTTPGGFAVDDPRGELSDAALDAAAFGVSRCLASLPEPSVQELPGLDCWRLPLRRDVDPAYLVFKAAPDWYPSRHSPDEQVFPCGVDPALCVAKGLVPTPDAPCACRATVQDNRVVVTTPNLKIFPAELLRLVTACNYVWRPPLAACAAPPQR